MKKLIVFVSLITMSICAYAQEHGVCPDGKAKAFAQLQFLRRARIAAQPEQPSEPQPEASASPEMPEVIPPEEKPEAPEVTPPVEGDGTKEIGPGAAIIGHILIAGALKKDRPPNILSIWIDDLGWENLSCYHQGLMGSKTPNC